MWSHYTSAHHGFAIRYKPEIVTTLATLTDYEIHGDVDFRDAVPDLCWFSDLPQDITPPVLQTKSSDWTYEAEHRVVLSGPSGQKALFRAIDPDLVAGEILGERVSVALLERALALRKARPEFTV